MNPPFPMHHPNLYNMLPPQLTQPSLQSHLQNHHHHHHHTHHLHQQHHHLPHPGTMIPPGVTVTPVVTSSSSSNSLSSSNSTTATTATSSNLSHQSHNNASSIGGSGSGTTSPDLTQAQRRLRGESEAARLKRLAKNAERMRQKRAAETYEEYKLRLAQNAERQRRRRALEAAAKQKQASPESLSTAATSSIAVNSSSGVSPQAMFGLIGASPLNVPPPPYAITRNES